MNNFWKSLLSLFIPAVAPAVQQMESHNQRAQGYVTDALAALDTAAAVALTHDQRTQQTVQAATQVIASITGTNAEVQQKASEIAAIRDAITGIIK